MVLTPVTSADVTNSMMDSARVGLEYIVENSDYTQKLALALDSKNFTVKKQVFELLSALCVFSSEGYNRTLGALEHFRNHKQERYRFKFIVHELQSGPTLEYQTAVIAFINCLILATSDVQERIRIRSEFLGLKLAQTLDDLRYKKKECSDLMVQLDVFDEQRESDESQLSPVLSNIDLSSPLEVFDAILRQIADSPQEIPFLSILQHLLRIDPKEPISDLVWDAAERLVHRATLLETKNDALRLLKAPSQSKSLQKIKGDKCTCNCHKEGRKGSIAISESSPGLPQVIEEQQTQQGSPGPPPPPPPPPPGPMGGPPPPPPPPPPLGGGCPPPPPPPPLRSKANHQTTSVNSNVPEDAPKLPQQSIPCPKIKMRTVNWNKIPSGQIFNSNKNNLWINFAKSYSNTASTLDWDALEGLFCIQTDKSNFTPSGTAVFKNVTAEKTGTKRESNEILLLDAKRSLNINIFLKQFRSSNRDIIQHIVDANSEEIGMERLRGLLKILPSKDEIEMLKAVSKEDQGRLGSAEKFMLELIQLKAYRLRIEAMLLKEDLETYLQSIESSINVILNATQEIKRSKQFQEVVFMILVAGNFLNSGGYAGDAVGVKLSSLQKIADIRGNQPGISLLNFISMQAEAKNPALISFSKDMVSLEEASKTSIEQVKTELDALTKKVDIICDQLVHPETPSEMNDQLGYGFNDAKGLLADLSAHLSQVDTARVDLAHFFCEDLQTFRLEECFKILYSFVVRWNQAALENQRRKKQEEEAKQRKKIREEQFQKRLQLGWETPQSVENFNNSNKTMALNPEDDIFIACSPRVVRRRLGSYNTENQNNVATVPGNSASGTPDQLALPSPDVTPNGSLRRRRSRVPSDEDETGLMDFLRSSGQEGSRERKGGTDQYGSLDRSWSRKGRRRPNLMDFVNDDRERPVSPAVAINEKQQNASSATAEVQKSESPAKEWRERIAAWFVDLENGGDGEMPKRRPPPRRFQRRLGLESLELSSRGLATLPEGEMGQEDSLAAMTTYQRVYPDRRSSLKLNTDVVSAMEAIEEVQSPVKEVPTSRKLSERSLSQEGPTAPARRISQDKNAGGRRSLIESLGSENHNEKLVLYIPEKSLPTTSSRGLRRNVSLSGERPIFSSTTSSTPASSSTEGFDRFASIRRSRRYKKDSETPTSTGLTRSASLYSTVRSRSRTDRENEKPEEPVKTKLFSDEPASRSSRSTSKPEPPNVGEDLKSSRVTSHPVILSSGGTSIVQIRSPSSSYARDNRSSSKAVLSSSPGTAERDEGFEESHSSLSETNSQTESHNIPAVISKSPDKKSQRILSTSFKLQSRPSIESDSSLNNNNNNTSNSNKTSSRASLLSSRSSLTSQTTVGTVKENEGKKKSSSSSVKIPDSKGFSAISPPSTPNCNGTSTLNGALDSNKSLSSSFMQQKNSKNLNTMAALEKPKSSSKGLTPRILSFMRPTASSTAKDKVEFGKGKSSKQSFR